MSSKTKRGANLTLLKAKENELINKKFNSWTVLKFDSFDKRFHSGRDHYKRKWLCKCECGVERSVAEYTLVNGKSKSCGCKTGIKMRENWKTRLDPEIPFKKVLAMYKRSAKVRNIEFRLSDEEFRRLTSGNCNYCNNPPETISKNWSRVGHNFIYVYNGIDRLDPTKGYILNNCTSCCSTCNYMKTDLSYPDFLKKVEQIYNNLIKNKKNNEYK